jgi:periplasmic protein TonB
MILPDYRHKLNDAETLRGITPHKLKDNIWVDIRKQYYWVMHYAVIVSLVSVILGFRFFPVFEIESSGLAGEQEIIDIEQIDITRQEERPPPPPRPPIVIESLTDTYLDDLDISWGELDLFDDALPPRPPPGDDYDDEHYFVAVEQMPELIGGISSLLQNLRYPELARRAGIEGTVFVLAYVDETGIVQRVEVARGVGGGLDEAAMEAVSKARFTPGKQRGVPRRVVVTVPVRFSLHDR